MSLRTQWPYAAKAIIHHEWVVNLLNVWVTFKFTMDQTVKPNHDLWICKVDGAPKAVTVSVWQDEWTILLTVPDVLALPGRVTLKYDGPSHNLRITWDKQWEPWGPILSIRVPYLWEDILVVDTVNKRVGIQPGVVAANPLGYALTIVSPDGNDQVGIYHDNHIAHFKTTDGPFAFQTDEGTDTDTLVDIIGKGDGGANLSLKHGTSGNYWFLRMSTNVAYLGSIGPTIHHIGLQVYANIPIQMFEWATEGETEKHLVYGWKAGDSEQRHVDLQISPDADNTALWSGVDDYVWDGNIRPTGRISSGTLTHSAVGPTDNLDVAGVNTVFIDCSLNDVIIGGFVGGIDGQVLQIVKICSAVQDVTLEHNEPHAFQKLFLHAGLDETLRGEYGGWTLVCDGSNWYDVSHAKHV